MTLKSSCTNSASAFLQLFSGGLRELVQPPSSQIPFLDALRSVAILLVISGHLSAEFAKRNGPNVYSRFPLVVNGWIGVDLFFVLSGFFIGSQLWKELKSSGAISIPRFVLRRGLRIWPLYFFVFICAFVFYPRTASKGYGWSDLVFLTNYFNRGIVGGSWSLCTEEQFYIIAPTALALFALLRKSNRSALPLLWALLLGVPLLRTAIWIQQTGAFFAHSAILFEPLYYNFHTHCDGLIMGLILANVWVSREDHSEAGRKAPILLALGVIILVVCRAFQHEILSFTGLALFFGSLVWFGLTRPLPFVDSRLFYWISRLSFGMYLMHGYFCRWVVYGVLPRFPMLAAFPASLRNCIGVVVITVLSAALAMVTFCLIEHPFLLLRKAILDTSLRHKVANSSVRSAIQSVRL